MGFFETFWTWLNGQLATYIGDNTANLAAVLEPAVVTMATIYVMVWGYLQLTGKIEEPLAAGLRRIVTIAVVLGLCLRLWLYNDLIVDTFYHAPAQLAAAVVHAPEAVASVDAIWNQGGAVAGVLWSKGDLWGGDFGFYIAGTIVWLMMGLLCVYAMFLISLSSIALSVLLALGPLFIAMLLFEGTRRFFQSWISQLVPYGLITVLTVLVATLLLQIVNSYAAQSLARGAALTTVDALDMLLVAALVFMVLRQVMPIAAGLAGGLALNSFGVISRGVSSAMRGASSVGGPVAAFAAFQSVGALGNAAYSTGRIIGTAAQSAGRRAYRQAGSSVEALSRHWRDRRNR